MENFETPQPYAAEATVELILASSGKRIANYAIDLAFFFCILTFWGVIIAMVAPEMLDSLDDSPGFGLLDRLLTMFLYGLLMSLIEAIFRGKSIGKFITGTKAVNGLDGSDISFATAFARGFSRAVPFDAFSALGNPCYPWHDKWTNTVVIDEREMKKRDLQRF